MRTRFGWALRAPAQDPEAAALQGISITMTARIAMFIGAELAGIAGALAAPRAPRWGQGDCSVVKFPGLILSVRFL
ncbi:hypothetical protein METH_18495 [Leisingera methylohalidivorans DSM 14336]|uniref:Uncharacterized protein n=1 Tax=Leisingera methylohalidivorans DSM 14336 TaxID=999552 RepID=V9W281_9RHOB|nr:hypothetical protein [Leisingera methylohalidivorans]AHD03282.1 hypothetical protein METH_18495 [Leisingera methylohalidivorans DSM 14336]